MNPWDCQSNRVFGTGGAFQTLYAHEGSGRHNCSVLVETLPFDTTQVTSPANGSNPQFGDPCHPLCAGAHVPAVAFSAGQSSKAGSLGCQEEVAPTLRGGSSGTNQVPTVCIDGDIARGAYMGKNGKGWNTDGVASTITTIDVPAVMTQYGEELAGTLTARGDSSPCHDKWQNVVCMADDTANASCDVELAGTLKCGGMPPSVVSNMIVRRLMPVECERVQGFPDGWTRIPYRGKPVQECPDGPRYKALGNSMAVPVMRWIGERIAKTEQIVTREGEVK
ncbi:hypothetical protein GJG86_07000 [Eggerthella sp. HF-4214]|uniref:Uncharacterized protein n=2 Tax=Eggerthella guodeyinii TaxID=2690837 RepID=A0A6N7RND3_9ACTN|nr:hypothetical protein [Eggerthella guodeyinii]